MYKYKSGLIFVYIGQYTRILVGMSFFKDGKGIETVYSERNINIAHFILGFKYFNMPKFHEFGEGGWNHLQVYNNNMTRLSELSPIALNGKESKKDFEDILEALI